MIFKFHGILLVHAFFKNAQIAINQANDGAK